MAEEDKSLIEGLECMEAKLAKEHVNELAQNVKSVAVEKEKKLEEIKKVEQEQEKKANPVEKKVDIDQKYKSLLNKINKQTRLEAEGEDSDQNGENDESVDEED